MLLNYDFEKSPRLLENTMGNKLFCTFSTQDKLEDTLEEIKEKYTILFGKIFILKLKNQNEFTLTYNVDFSNVSSFLENTILVHRKKQVNTLYTINALNQLIKNLNGGILDETFEIKWNDYKNRILLTEGGELKQIKTELFSIEKL